MLGFYVSCVSILGFAASSTLKVGKILQNKTRQRAVKPASLRRPQLWPWLTQLQQNEGWLGCPSLYQGCLPAASPSLPHVCFCTSHNQSLIASITSQLPTNGVRSLPDILRRKHELEAGVVAPSTVSVGKWRQEAPTTSRPAQSHPEFRASQGDMETQLCNNVGAQLARLWQWHCGLCHVPYTL